MARANVLVEDLDLYLVDHFDAPRLEVVAGGLPVFGSAQLAVDATLGRPGGGQEADGSAVSRTGWYWSGERQHSSQDISPTANVRVGARCWMSVKCRLRGASSRDKSAVSARLLLSRNDPLPP